MKVILHKDENQKNLITHAIVDIEKVKDELNGVWVDYDFLNMDYLDAYNFVGEEVSMDLEKAREIKVEKIRAQRDEIFIEFDKCYDIAVKDGIDLTELQVKRQKLKDAPQKAEAYLDSCISLEEIENLKIENLI